MVGRGGGVQGPGLVVCNTSIYVGGREGEGEVETEKEKREGEGETLGTGPALTAAQRGPYCDV